MKARVISSLALPAALATAGLLNTAEAAYAAALNADPLAASAPSGYQQQPTSGDVALISSSAHPCTPMGNVTISHYGHHCCSHMSNVTFCHYGHHHSHHHDYDYDDWD
ncbi:hypothetical protein ABZ468_12505 [Streptomyces sp. NPDC005708]|uniref:hypothetical protein n=1 Tax=unclassified Streptomyces TaxID=2593676 RepID=UPI0033DEA562